MQLKLSKYWMCQLGGWGANFAINTEKRADNNK